MTWSGSEKDTGKIKGGMVSREQYVIIYSIETSSYPLIHEFLECRGSVFFTFMSIDLSAYWSPVNVCSVTDGVSCNLGAP